MTVTVPPLPTGLEDPAGEEKRNFMNGQIESSLNDALDRLCKPAS
jgi:D-alanyl-D-alanine carboxypeptidase